ncbi:SMI1/KNR4 family protein [Paenibacillus camerounensis]|uniref:SMI1/KNR4 family protein n=1 Tax=Paenibacillus camerounensis TaxID=1243663 RepID=UPI0005A8011F|nr:SMI1/KNR4 family protein [Paenibacillus camerounensis]
MIKELIVEISRMEGCELLPPAGIPEIMNENHRLPADLLEFYSICGGAVLFGGADYAITLVPPDQFAPANPVIVGELFEEDISASWYIIGDAGEGDYITIDLAAGRLGRSYQSFHETHGLIGDCPVIAECFTSLLQYLLANQGGYFYWLKDEFISLGDAYDGEGG